jgi:hypothetical protein
MEKLNISIGILAWKSGQTLKKTLRSYADVGLFDMVEETTVFFNEFNANDHEIIKDYRELYMIPNEENIGIGKAFLEIAKQSTQPYLLLLEHDWVLIEDVDTTYNRLKEGITLLNKGIDCARYRHRKTPGHPLYSLRHKGNELNYYDSEIQANSPHLLDSIHWIDNPTFPQFEKQGEWFITTSEWGNWTNNPCLYKREFYIDTVEPFAGTGIELEGNISKWWNRQGYKVAHGEGLFTHNDLQKYGHS